MVLMGSLSFLECSLDPKWLPSFSTTLLDRSSILLTGFVMLYTVRGSSRSTNWQNHSHKLEDPNWNASTYTIHDAKNAIDQNPFNVQTWNGDLSAYRAKGGKVCKLRDSP